MHRSQQFLEIFYKKLRNEEENKYEFLVCCYKAIFERGFTESNKCVSLWLGKTSSPITFVVGASFHGKTYEFIRSCQT